jgi:hypothetical protein
VGLKKGLKIPVQTSINRKPYPRQEKEKKKEGILEDTKFYSR